MRRISERTAAAASSCVWYRAGGVEVHADTDNSASARVDQTPIALVRAARFESGDNDGDSPVPAINSASLV